jgi:hypothetical protein
MIQTNKQPFFPFFSFDMALQAGAEKASGLSLRFFNRGFSFFFSP